VDRQVCHQHVSELRHIVTSIKGCHIGPNFYAYERESYWDPSSNAPASAPYATSADAMPGGT
jgi:hypothetical protein